MWRDRIVPLAMERMAGEVDRSHLSLQHLNSLRIFPFVRFRAHLEASIGRRRSNQLDDGAITAQRLAPPIDADEREQAVLDLVPFAGSGRQVANRDGFFNSFASF